MTGDNGLIGKAGEAKQANEEAIALEKIKTEVAGSYGLTGKIDIDSLNINLSRIGELKYKNNSLSETNKIEKLPDWVDVQGYKVDILEDGTVEKRPDYEKLRSMYGTIVNGYTGYTATDVKEWKLLYVDEENNDAFLIASDISSLNAVIPLTSSKGIKYIGSNDVAKFEYGKKYNSLWLDTCITESKNENAQATAYMCDPSNWEKYESGNVKYAAGGPTFEMILASAKNMQIKDINSIITNINPNGYSLSIGTEINLEQSELYKIQKYYWIASPMKGGTSHMIAVRRDGCLDYYSNVHTAPKYRPVVCFPASAIKIDGENLSV